ncbi:Ig-like domain-containing protein [Methanomassiliicoccales archaeon LGM-RCC1]|nr:Ig-like domain-containing protein [Methanomassiliicoccales archaeon LGM-RCC1]
MNRKAMNLLLLITAMVAVSFLFIGDTVDADDEGLTSEYTYSEGVLTVTGTTMEGTKVINLTVNVSEEVKIPAFADIDESNWTYSAKIKCTLVDNATLTVEAQRLNEAKVTKNIDLVIKQSVVDVTGIEINQLDKEISLYVGDSATLRYEIKPSNATDKTVIWSSDKPNIASVDPKTGAIKANAAGNAVITATAGGKTDTAKVKVLNVPTTDPSYTFDIRIEFHTNKLNLGQSGYDLNALKRGITLTATGKDAGAALEKALKDNKIPCSFFSGSSGGESLQHWVNHIFGMGDTHFDNGVWMYWVQYHNGSYNDKTLGYYKEGGSFELVYGMTAGDNSSAQRIQAVEIPQVKQTWTGRDITGLSNTSAYTVVSGGTGKDVGSYTAILRLNNGYAWEDATFTDKSVRWTIEKQVSESSTTNADGSVTKKTEEKDENGSTLTETTTKTKKDPSGTTTETKDVKVTTKDTSGKVTGMSEVKEETVKDKAGNVTHHSTVETSMDKDGNVLSSKEEVKDYTKEKDDAGNDVSVETVSTVFKDKDGNVIENKEVATATKSVTDEDGSVSDVRTVTETEKDAEGNVKGSTEKSETKDKDGNITEKSEVLRDKDGNETYSKVEEIVPTNVIEEEGKTVTESCTKVTEKESGKTTVTEESVKETVGADGAKETEKAREESVTDPNGSTSSKKVTEKVVEDGESKLTSTQTESKDASGKETSEKKVVAESKDGSVRSSVEVPQDGSPAEIVTVLGSGQSGGVMSISSEQVKLAVSLQEKVSGEITDVQQEKVMLAESTTDSISLTLSGEAMKGMSDSGAVLNLVSSEGSLKVSKEVLGNLSGEDEVLIQFSASEEISLSEDQKDAIGENASVLEIKVSSGGESLGNSINGVLTIVVKHVAAEGMVPAMYYVADNGDMEKLEGSYDAERQEMTGVTTHCSIYAVIDEDPNAGDDNALLYAGVAIITILAVVAVAGFLYMRRS